MASPKPKPTHLKLLEGNPGKRPLNEDEPKPRPVTPKRPRWLTNEAKREWNRIAPALQRLGLLTEIDGTALAAYCQTYARWRQAEEYLKKHGTVYPIRDENGSIKYIQQVPQVAIANKLLQQLKAFCEQFGMTPSSRGRLTVVGNKEDEFDDLLS